MIPFTLLFSVAILLGLYFYKRFPDRERTDRELLALMPAAVTILGGLLFYYIANSIFSAHSWSRLQRTLFIATGRELYFGKDAGPIKEAGGSL